MDLGKTDLSEVPKAARLAKFVSAQLTGNSDAKMGPAEPKINGSAFKKINDPRSQSIASFTRSTNV